MSDPGFGYVGQFYSAATNHGITVVSGESTTEPVYLTGYWTTWSSDDGLNWRMSDSWQVIQGRHYAWIQIVPYRDGFVALANVDDLDGTHQETDIFTSSDGTLWTQASVLDGAQIRSTTNVGGNLIAAGLDDTYGGQLWLSSDAVSWQPSNGPAASGVTFRSKLTAYGGRVVLFAPVYEQTASVIDMWFSDDAGHNWRRAVVPDIPDATASNALGMLEGTLASGPTGWVAAGWYDGKNPGNFSWWSRDGTEWQPANSMPRGVKTMVGYAGGFVAGGYRSTGPCCANSGAGRGVSWTSADGLDWRQGVSSGWKNQDLQVLATNENTLIGLTVDPATDVITPGGLWLADLETFAQ